MKGASVFAGLLEGRSRASVFTETTNSPHDFLLEVGSPFYLYLLLYVAYLIHGSLPYFLLPLSFPTITISTH